MKFEASKTLEKRENENNEKTQPKDMTEERETNIKKGGKLNRM